MISGRRHEAASGFHQAAGEQARTGQSDPCRTFLGLVGLLRKIERVAHGGCKDHLPGLRRESIYVGVIGRIV